jgi:uncharacterized membrane protein YkoI
MKSLTKVNAQLIAALLVCLFSSNCFAKDDSTPQHTSINLDEATKQIIKNDGNRVLGAETELINGKEVHVIKVLTPDGRIQHYKIDAETGEIIN